MPSRSRSDSNFSTNRSIDPMNSCGDLDDLGLGQFDPGPAVQVVDDPPGLAVQVVGHGDRPC